MKYDSRFNYKLEGALAGHQLENVEDVFDYDLFAGDKVEGADFLVPELILGDGFSTSNLNSLHQQDIPVTEFWPERTRAFKYSATAWGEVMNLPLARSATASLKKVVKTEDAPFRYICRVAVNVGIANIEIATGILVGPKHVLTAAHPLVDGGSLVKPEQIMITPGLNGDDALFGNSGVIDIVMPKGFSPGDEVTVNDFALIKTEEDFSKLDAPIFPGSGFWGTARHKFDDRGSVVGAIPGWRSGSFKVNISGYPLARRDTQWHSYDDTISLSKFELSGLSLSEQKRLLLFKNAIEPGMSGSPVWVTRHHGLGGRSDFAIVLGMKEINGKRYAVGRLIDRELKEFIARHTRTKLRTVKHEIEFDGEISKDNYQILEDSEFLPILPAVIPYFQIVIDGQFYPPPAGVTVKNFFASSVPRFKRLKLKRSPTITAVVIHETGTSSVDGTISTLQAKGSGAHFIVAPDGSVTQHGDLVTDYLIHANHYNCHSVGIEVVNPYCTSKIQLPWKETLTAGWVFGKNYIVPTPQQAETVYKLIQWLTQQSYGRLQIPRIWIGKQDNDFAMNVTPDTGFRKVDRKCGRPAKTNGILAHANIYGSMHADGAWLVLYAYLRSEHGYPPAKAYEEAIALSKNVRLKRFMGKGRGHWVKLPEKGTRKLPGDYSCVRPRVEELELAMEQEHLSCKIVPIAPKPHPGFFYTLKYKVDGVGLINLAGRAYGAKSYAEQLKLAQRINAHIYNKRFWVRTENTKNFPDGTISFSPRFTASIRAQANANQGTAPKGRAFATIYIPKLNETA